VKNIAVIIPAYNEEKNIASVVNEINTINMGSDINIDIVVVNDCSLDHTADIASALNCILIDLPVNTGIGGAVQTGFIYAFENNYDFAMQVDGDGQHPPTEIPKLITAILPEDFDVIIGSRFIEKVGFLSTFSRRLGIIFFKYLIRFFCGITITDSTSGFRIINRKALALVNEYYPDEYPEPESIILYHKNNLKIGEVPVTMIKRQGGVSSIRAFSSVYYMVKVSLAIFFTYIKTKSNHGKRSTN
jgi:glycosyltransferase involved in cell wall biosynthesis